MTSNRTNSTTPTTRQQQQGPLQCYMMANPSEPGPIMVTVQWPNPTEASTTARGMGCKLPKTQAVYEHPSCYSKIQPGHDCLTDWATINGAHVGRRLLSSSGIKRHAMTDKCHRMTSYIKLHNDNGFQQHFALDNRDAEMDLDIKRKYVADSEPPLRISACFRTDFETVFTWFKT